MNIKQKKGSNALKMSPWGGQGVAEADFSVWDRVGGSFRPILSAGVRARDIQP